MRIIFLLTLTLGLCRAVPAQAVESLPPPVPPGYDMQVRNAPPRLPLPPQLPAALPSGGANLDEAWIQDGGARLYWNTLVIPRQLRMGGARFTDPAAVPELLPASTGKKARLAPRRVSSVPTVKLSPAPAGSGSTALRPPYSAIPAASSQNSAASAPLPIQPVDLAPLPAGATTPMPPAATATPAGAIAPR